MTAGAFTLDGRSIPFRAGQTVLEAAADAGVYIPHLCYRPGFAPHGSCKLCSVTLDGRPASACTTPARAGSVVESETPELQADRRLLVEMLFVEGNHICPSCQRSGDCTLQAVAYHLGMVDYHYDHFYPPRGIDASHPDVLLDRDRCILCELCVRASRDVDGKNVFAIGHRGIGSRVIVDAASGRLGDTDLAATDVAAQVCPTGAILPRHGAFARPIGQRRYDVTPVREAALAEAQAQARREDHDG